MAAKPLAAAADGSPSEEALAEGSSFSLASADHPLHRKVVVSVRASLNDLCLQSSKGIWAPSNEALRSVFQQKKFTSLDGSMDSQGDLKSVILHELSVHQSVSTFPISLGTRITGVDDRTFASTGEAYSMVILPQSNVATETKLQADNVSLAYDFAKQFPGYTADNLADKGVHEVAQRRFVLVAHDHPLVSAISDNADKLQMGDISMMPEGLVKISQGLYESILPIVKQQVESQIRVRDFSNASVSIQPAEYKSWSDARAALMQEAKRPLKSRMGAEICGQGADKEAEIRAKYAKLETEIEHNIDHTPHDVHMTLGFDYNFLSK